jgi:hypothetical protein
LEGEAAQGFRGLDKAARSLGDDRPDAGKVADRGLQDVLCGRGLGGCDLRFCARSERICCTVSIKMLPTCSIGRAFSAQYHSGSNKLVLAHGPHPPVGLLPKRFLLFLIELATTFWVE